MFCIVIGRPEEEFFNGTLKKVLYAIENYIEKKNPKKADFEEVGSMREMLNRL